MSFWANVFLGRCPSVQLSSGHLSFWANVLLGKRPSGQMSSGQMSFSANVFLGKRLLGKGIMGKCVLGQEPLKPRTNVSCRFLENQLAISFLLFDISYR
jgi:hypothetical protein